MTEMSAGQWKQHAAGEIRPSHGSIAEEPPEAGTRASGLPVPPPKPNGSGQWQPATVETIW